jgi:hypothetical protein
MSRYVMVSLIPCQRPNVRPIVVMPGGSRYTLARYGKEFEASCLSDVATCVTANAMGESADDHRDWSAGEDSAQCVVSEHRYTLDLDTGEVRRWRVLVTVEAANSGKMEVHR